MATRVLIAHDDTQRLERAVAELEARGFDVVATPDGGDAYARFVEDPPDLVVCSEALPGLSGLNLARSVRAQSATTPVLMLVAEPWVAEVEGVTIQPEPFDVEQLCTLFPWLAPRGRAASAASAAAAPLDAFTLQALKRLQRGTGPVAQLDDRGLLAIARIAREEVVTAGELVAAQGEVGTSCFLVLQGQVRVTLQGGDDVELARIGEGGFIGEAALFSDRPRPASVWSVGTSILLRFERHELVPMLEFYPGLRDALAGRAAERSEETLWGALRGDNEVQRSLADLEDAPVLLLAPRAPVAASRRPAAAPAVRAATEDPSVADDRPPAHDRPTRRTLPKTIVVAAAAAVAALVVAWLATERPWSSVPSTLALAQGAEVSPTVDVPPGAAAPLLAALAAGDVDWDLRGDPSWTPELFEDAPAPPTSTALAPGPAEGVAATKQGAPESSAPAPGLVVGPAAAPDGQPGASPRTPTTSPAPASPTPAVATDAASVVATERSARAQEPAGGAAEAPARTAQSDPTRAAPRAKAAPAGARQKMLELMEQKKYADAVELGRELRSHGESDWETELAVADARRLAGEPERAIASYHVYLRRFPESPRIDDARFWLAELLIAQGRKDEARELLKQVVESPAATHRAEAQERLGGL